MLVEKNIVSFMHYYLLVMVMQLNRAKIVEKEKNELEGPKNEAVEYLCRENEMAVKRNMLFQKYM